MVCEEQIINDLTTFSIIKKQKLSDIKIASNINEVLKLADALAILTEWNEFTKIEFPKTIFDGRNIITKKSNVIRIG